MGSHQSSVRSNLPRSQAALSDCRHHWLIETRPREDGLLHGLCKGCGQEHTWPYDAWEQTLVNFNHRAPTTVAKQSTVQDWVDWLYLRSLH